MSLRSKGRVYGACCKKAKTWAVPTEQPLRLERTERRMLWGIGGKPLREKMPTVELREHINVESVLDVLWRGRLRWYGHVL